MKDKPWDYAPDTFPYFINHLYFQYYSLLVFLFSVALMVVVSYLTKPQPVEQIQGLTYATTVAADREKSRRSWGALEVIASVVVCVIILAVYLFFRG